MWHFKENESFIVLLYFDAILMFKVLFQTKCDDRVSCPLYLLHFTVLLHSYMEVLLCSKLYNAIISERAVALRKNV